MLQSLPIAEWKWEHVTMDFVMGLSRTQWGSDTIWVVVDRLTKSAHFIPMRVSDSVDYIADLYIREIVRLHGVLVMIISNKDPRFTARLWRSLQSALGTRLTFSIAYHPQTDGRSKRTIQILEDMLRVCILDFKGSWEKHLPFVECAYNNSFQFSIAMALFAALHGRPYRSPMCWAEVSDAPMLGSTLR